MPSGDIHNNLTDRGGGIVRAFIFKFEKVTVTKHVQRSRREGGGASLGHMSSHGGWQLCV